MAFLRGHWQLIFLMLALFALWRTPVVIPLKLLVVFLHELSHGLAAIFTGGEIERITLSAQQGGTAWTRGGNGFAILSAGYVGSLVIGVILFLAARWSRADRLVTAALGTGMLAITALYVRDPFALVFCGVTGAALLAVAWFLSHGPNDLLLRIVGLASMIYVPFDIFSDTIARSELRSDARMLAEAYGGATVLWGGLWLVVSLAVIGLSLRYGLGERSNVDWHKRGPQV